MQMLYNSAEAGQRGAHRAELEVALALRQAGAADNQWQQGWVLRGLPDELQRHEQLHKQQRKVRGQCCAP